jgi:plastocyanin
MRSLTVATALLLALGTAGCSSDDDTASPSPAPSSSPSASATAPAGSGPAVILANRGNKWVPTELTLKAGESVLVRDTDPGAPHNFVVDGVGRSETMNEGDTFTLKFPTAGRYTFVCTFHESQGMTGTITVS